MRIFLFLLTSILITEASMSQSSEDSVKAVVNDLFNGMRTGDGALVKKCFGDSSILQTISRTRDGRTVVRNESVDGFVSFVNGLKKDSADERITFETVKIDGPLAIAWTPYQFYHNGQFSHCGVNSFQLVRINSIWKIQYLIDTRRRQGCK